MKVGLNPCDYFTLALDEEIRQQGMSGNVCGLVIELAQTPDAAQLAQRITQLSTQFPLILASLQPHQQRFYWCERATPPRIFFQHQAASGADEALFQQTTIEELINQVEPRTELAPLTFHLLHSSKHCRLFIRWLHPLLDALGIALVVRYLCTDDAKQRQLFDTPPTEALIALQLKKMRLWQKARLFFKAYRYINQLDQQRSIIPAQALPPQRLRQVTYKLSPEQSQAVAKLARQQLGLTGISLYYIGCLMRALEKVFPNQAGDAYCIPYAFNLRKQKALAPLLGNHIGTLFPQAPRDLLNHRSALFAHLKQQHTQVIRQQLDYAFFPVMWAASFLSLKKHGENLRNSYKHGTERSSCLFSHVNLEDLAGQKLLSCDINGFFHLSQVPAPPGLALLACQYQQQLTLSYNYIDPLFNAEKIAQLHEQMLQELLDNAQ